MERKHDKTGCSSVFMMGSLSEAGVNVKGIASQRRAENESKREKLKRKAEKLKC
jgi:hypothetical protein